MGEGAGTIIGEMGTRKRRKSPSPAISTGERGLGEEHDSSQGQEEGKSHAQNVGARTVLIKLNRFHIRAVSSIRKEKSRDFSHSIDPLEIRLLFRGENLLIFFSYARNVCLQQVFFFTR